MASGPAVYPTLVNPTLRTIALLGVDIFDVVVEVVLIPPVLLTSF